jgi:hypothetical protein
MIGEEATRGKAHLLGGYESSKFPALTMGAEGGRRRVSKTRSCNDARACSFSLGCFHDGSF